MNDTTTTEQVERCPIQSAIDSTVNAWRGNRRQLNKELASIRWRIVNAQGQAIRTNENGESAFVPLDLGDVFDGRDNQVLKCRFFSVLMNQSVTPELV